MSILNVVLLILLVAGLVLRFIPKGTNVPFVIAVFLILALYLLGVL